MTTSRLLAVIALICAALSLVLPHWPLIVVAVILLAVIHLI